MALEFRDVERSIVIAGGSDGGEFSARSEEFASVFVGARVRGVVGHDIDLR
jgi:hypothetical protein